MRKIQATSIICAVCMAAGSAFAQSSVNTPTSTGTDYDRDDVRSTDTAKAGESTTFFKSKDLVGANIKDSQGNKVGDISELLVNHKTGESFAAVGVSGGRSAVIPIQAFSVSRPAGMVRNAEVTLNTTKQELESGPAIAKNEWSRLDDQSFVQSIYTHYNVQQPSAMGAGSDASLGGSSSSRELKHQKVHKSSKDADSYDDKD